jgi:hypothetical protein
MEQTKRSAALSQNVSSLEGQLSALMGIVVHLEECDLYMTKIIEAARKQLSCKLLGSPVYFVDIFCVMLIALCLGICLDPAIEDHRVSESVAALERVSSGTNTF